MLNVLIMVVRFRIGDMHEFDIFAVVIASGHFSESSKDVAMWSVRGRVRTAVGDRDGLRPALTRYCQTTRDKPPSFQQTNMYNPGVPGEGILIHSVYGCPDTFCFASLAQAGDSIPFLVGGSPNVGASSQHMPGPERQIFQSESFDLL